MAKITPAVNGYQSGILSRVKLIHRSSYRDIVEYHKNLSGENMFTRIAEIRAYIKKCEQKRFYFENSEVCTKEYLTATRTIE